MLSKNLEMSLHRALALAIEYRHEYATLEHLLLALSEDPDAASVMRGCGVNINSLRDALTGFLKHDLAALVVENLREATKQNNAWNVKKPCSNLSGIKGVSWSKKDRRWVVRLSVENRNRYFGGYFDINVAKFVAETMRHKYHGQFANHN